jgi:hypothetical protein
MTSPTSPRQAHQMREQMTRRNHFSASMEKQSDEWLQMCISNPEKFEPSALQAAEWEIARRLDKREPVAAEIWAASYGFKTSDVIRLIEDNQITGMRTGDEWFVLARVKHGDRGAEVPATVLEQGHVGAVARAEAVQKPAAYSVQTREWFRKWFAPRYDEVTLFVMSSSALLLYLWDAAFRASVSGAIAELDMVSDLRLYFLMALLLGGLALSLAQGFIRHEKREFERELMLMFAIFFQVFSSFFAGFHLMNDPGYTIHWMFPLWNILSGILLMMLYRLEVIGVSAIIDTKASRVQIAICILPVAVFIFLNHNLLGLHWSLVLSMSVALAGVLSHAVDMFSLEDSGQQES